MEGMKLRWLFLSVVLLVSGCVGEEEQVSVIYPDIEPEQKPEQSEDEYQSGRQLVDHPKDCQMEQVVADLGEDGLVSLTQEWMEESFALDNPSGHPEEAIEDLGQAVRDMSNAQSLPDFLAERGYDC